jgi:hypothetical protein
VLRSIVTILVALIISQIAAPPALAERKIAFVVGIDKYDNLGPQQQLQRAVNDARSVGGACPRPIGHDWRRGDGTTAILAPATDAKCGEVGAVVAVRAQHIRP